MLRSRLPPIKKQALAKEGDDTLKGCGVGCLVIVVLGILFSVLIGGGSGSSAKDEAPTKIDAWVMAQQFVEDRLKAPATADYPTYSEDYVQDLGGSMFRVTAYVDSENSFGAKVRTKFICSVKHVGGDKWILKGFRLLE